MPIVYMMISVLTWSLFPLLSAWSIDKVSVFEYIFWTYTVGLFASWVLLRCMPGYQAMKAATLPLVNKRILFEIFLCSLTVVLSFACLFTAFDHMSKAAATMIYEIWPIAAMYITPLLVAKQWARVAPKDLVFSFLALLGVGFLLYPELPGGHWLSGDWHEILYASLPLMAGIFMALSSALKLRVTHLLRNDAYPVTSLLMVQVMWMLALVLLTVPFVFFWPDKKSVYTPENIGAILFIGLFVSTLGTVAYTLAVLRSEKSNIVVLWYLTPILSVVWLWAAGQSAITPYIVLGCIFIITSNLVMTVKADHSLSYTAAVLMMLLCGVYAYFVEGLAMNDYYQAISVPIVFYAILVAFLMDRLIRSDKLEEVKAIEAVNYIEDHAGEIRGSVDGYVEHLLAMVSTNNVAAVNRHYRAVRNADEPALRGMFNALDELAASKVRGTSFAEMFILLLVGTLIVGSGMAFRPQDIIGDTYSVVLSLTVMFIFFTVLDLQNQRKCFYIERDANGHRSLSGRVTGNLASEQALSAVLIVVIMGAFLGLLVLKRYPGLLG